MTMTLLSLRKPASKADAQTKQSRSPATPSSTGIDTSDKEEIWQMAIYAQANLNAKPCDITVTDPRLRLLCKLKYNKTIVIAALYIDRSLFTLVQS